MQKILQIVFTIISALCVAAVLPVGAFLGFTWAIVLALVAFTFYLLMLTCKQAQIAKEAETKKDDSSAQEEITPSVSDNTENSTDE